MLRATVKKSTGQTRHTLGSYELTGDEREFPPAAYVKIEAEESGVFLLRFDAEGQFAGDSWHQSIEEAKRQARFEYGITDSDWTAQA